MKEGTPTFSQECKEFGDRSLIVLLPEFKSKTVKRFGIVKIMNRQSL